MSSDALSRVGQNAPKSASVSFGIWTAVIFAAHAIGMAIFTGLAGAALSIPVRNLLLPYTALLYCGLVLSPLLYWARLSRDRAKSCALRLAIAIFLYMQALMLALGFSTIKLNILSQAAVINSYAPFMMSFSWVASVLLYIAARQMFKVRPSR